MERFDVVVDNRVRMPTAAMQSDTVDELIAAFTHENPRYPDEGPAFEKTFKFDPESGEISLPRGGMSRVRRILSERGELFQVRDRREPGDRAYLDDDWDGRPIPRHDVTLWEWQQKAVEAIIVRQNCILRAATGAGKTTAGLATFAMCDTPTLVVVWTGGLLDQWVERLCKEMGLRKEDIGIIGGGKRRTTPITVAMQQTLAEGIDPRWLKAFGAILCDEVHRFAAESFFAAIDPFPARYRVGMSADETRHDQREYLIHDLFGDVVADIKEQDVLDAGHVVDVEIRVVPTDFEANWYRAAVASGNKFHLRNAHHKLLRAMWENERRNAIIKKLVQSEVKQGEQVMVLSQRREHCLMLDREFTASGITSGIMLGGAEAKTQFNQTKEDVRTGKARVITGTISAIGTGLDFPAIGRGIVTMPIANNKQLMQQVRGRFCRACEETGKTKGVLYYMWDRAVHGRRPLENLVKWNRTVTVLNNRGEWGKETWVDGKVVLGSMRSGIKGGSISKLRNRRHESGQQG